MKSIIALLAFFTLTFPTFAQLKISTEYQSDADTVRLRHLKYYGELIEEYHKKHSKYPLQGKSSLQNYVHIAAPHQKKYTKGGPPFKHDVTDLETFRKELEKGLGRKISFKFDPQKVPTAAPVFYIYMVSGNTYFFAVHLHNKFPFTENIAPKYNKLEITNAKPPLGKGLWHFQTLKADKHFKKAHSKKLKRSAWFKKLEDTYK